jgi:hypothetical protein
MGEASFSLSARFYVCVYMCVCVYVCVYVCVCVCEWETLEKLYS